MRLCQFPCNCGMAAIDVSEIAAVRGVPNGSLVYLRGGGEIPVTISYDRVLKVLEVERLNALVDEAEMD